jgi:hypothetical protein
LGIADYELSKAVPEELKSTLPSIEELEDLQQTFGQQVVA